MSRDLQIIRELTEIARTAGELGPGRGRYARTPDFAAPSHPSSRPRSDRGTTFHFSHKTISKRQDVSEGNHSQTPAAAHQGYIERPSATERSEPEITEALLEPTLSPSEEIASGAGFEFPERSADPVRISFGTLGKTKAARKEFWNQVEASEGKSSRVQSRIIAELPAELDRHDRSMIARDFCQAFEERGLPYWATVHAPTKKNDPRNYHLHVTYFDRPAAQDSTGAWDFAIIEKKKRANGSYVDRRPFKKPKHPETRAIGWPKLLRRIYADTCNFYLSLSGQEKRHDPRSYRDSGIRKEPTEHLGNKCSALEAFGLDTEPGKRNARREIRWRFAQAEEPWITRAEKLTAPEFQDEAASGLRDSLLQIASEGITLARRSTSYQVTSELLTHRVTKRHEFLGEEVERLAAKDNVSQLGVDAQNVIALRSENDLIQQRMNKIQMLAKKCRASSKRLGDRASKLKSAFDKMMKDAMEDDLFLTGEPDLVPIDEMVADEPEVPPQGDPFIEAQDLSDISDFLADLQPERAAETSDQESAEQHPGEQSEAQDDGHDKATTSQPAFDPKVGSRSEDPIERIVAGIASGDRDDESDRGPSDLEAADFPGAWAMEKPSGPEDVQAIDQKLREMNNRRLRLGAIANRDATDICPSGKLRDDLNRGWLVMRFEAERRGLDLDTGVHDPARATDAERAELHLDQEPCPIRVIRKDLARQRVRT